MTALLFTSLTRIPVNAIDFLKKLAINGSEYHAFPSPSGANGGKCGRRGSESESSEGGLQLSKFDKQGFKPLRTRENSLSRPNKTCKKSIEIVQNSSENKYAELKL